MAVWTKAFLFGMAALFLTLPAGATPFTRTVPATGVTLPDEYPQAGGVAIVLTGANGNIYYQFSDPDGAFVGFQFRGQPTRFRGNPFTINDPIPLNCGVRTCTQYFGGSIARVDIRFSAYDGDTQPGGFDENDIRLRLNGFDVGSWSGLRTERTNNDGTQSQGFETGFGNNSFNTGWFSSTDQALLQNILTTERTITQVFDRDPNDNFWDFRRGPRLPREDLRTIAPGYEFEKSITSGSTTFAQVGDVITYAYVVRNIGSVRIDDISVIDDRIPNVQCPANNDLPRTASGGTPAELTCTASYTITQADVDAGGVTNVARANGTPEFGELGEVEDTETVTGPARTEALTLSKVGSPDPFGPVGSLVTYGFTVTNTGNTTLRNVVVADPLLPGLTCTAPALLPLSADNTDNTLECTGTYRVTQADVDRAATGGTLDNTASVAATGPSGTRRTATDTDSLAGPAAAPALTVTKRPQQTSFATDGETLTFLIDVRNTGTVTFPATPTVTDDTADSVSCPAGPVAPGATVTCTATYAVDLADLDAGQVVNTAAATIDVGGQTATDSDIATVPADRRPALTVEKSLAAGPNPIADDDAVLTYSYVVRNTGNVTVSDISVSDDRVGVTCPAASSIAPGASITCTSAPYDVNQSDVDAGGVTNVAAATGTPAGGGSTTSPDATLTVPVDRRPALTLDKQAEMVAAADFVPGAMVDYTYLVINSGNVTLSSPVTVSDDRVTNVSCDGLPVGGLAPGASLQCAGTYEVTVADIDAGQVTNVATATSGGTTSPSDTATIPQAGTPDVGIAKEALTASFDDTSDVLSYRFTVTNTGDVTLTPGNSTLTVIDPDVDFAPACTQPATLLPGDSYQCTGTFDGLSGADLDAGAFVNTARAQLIYQPTGAPQPVTVVSPDATARVPADVTPAFDFDKATTDSFAAVDDVVTYAFTVTNQTEQTLTTVTVTDPLIPTLDCTLGPIAGLGTASCTGTYRVTQADLDRGQVDNTATAEGVSPQGTRVTETDDATAPGPAEAPVLDVTKIPLDALTAAGDDLRYRIEVRNAGNVTVTDIDVTDPLVPAQPCFVATLAPQATVTACTVTYTATQADIDRGFVENTASAAGETTRGTPVSDTGSARVDGPAAAPSLSLSKAASGAFASAGEQVGFVLTVENTGNVTLTGVTVTDELFDPDLVCTLPDLAPGAVDRSCVGTYTTDQADVNAGSFDNDAEVVATSAAPGGGTVRDDAAITVQGPAAMPGVALTKTERDGSGSFALNTAETFDITVRNTGNVTLTNLRVVDAAIGLDCALDPLDPGQTATACANGDPLSGSQVPDQGDVDLGSLVNVARVTGEAPSGAAVSDDDRVTLNGPSQMPALTLAKSATAGAGFDAVGDGLAYDYVVTNSGNVTITAPIRVTDDRTTVDCPALPAGGLAPGAALTCTATDAVDQDDLDAGSVTNTATAAVDQPVVPSAAFPTGVAAVGSNPDDATVTAAQAPSIRAVKRLAPGGATSFDGPNQTLTFVVEITNTGNVTLDEVQIDDPLGGVADQVCATDLAPGASTVCPVVSYGTDQEDVDDGAVENVATPSFVFDGAETAGTDVSVTVPAVQTPELAATKTFLQFAPNTFAAGSVASYDFEVRNTGNVTVDGPITVEDSLIGTIPCGAGPLAPGGAATCSGTYTVTLADVQNLGSVTNVATGNGFVDGAPEVSDPVSVTVPAGAQPALSVTKSTTATGFSTAGEMIDYTYVVTNTSSGQTPPAFANAIEIVDDRIPNVVCDPATDSVANDGQLEPGESRTCTGTYTVTQADLDAEGADGTTGGFVTNNATAMTEFAGQTVDSAPAQVTVTADAAPGIEVAKGFENLTDAGQPVEAGDTVRFTITTTNTGMRTLSQVAVTDPLLPVLACEVGGTVATQPLTLAPAQDAICTGDYTVTQADVDAQLLTNTASVTGTDPAGTAVTDDGIANVPVVAADPMLEVEKALAPGEPGGGFAAGQELTFVITVRNIGNITFSGVAVEDSLAAGTCAIGTLAPGAEDDTCTFTYVATQADVDQGFFDNVATATGTPANPTLDPVVEDDELRVDGPDAEPEISLVKEATPRTFAAEGDRIDYVYRVSNIGNVTLFEDVQLTDDVVPATDLSCPTTPPEGIPPLGSITCTATYAVSQADVDRGFVTNVADATLPNQYGPDLAAQADETATAGRAPGLTVTKTPSATEDLQAGDVVTYTYVVQNTGNVTLTDVTLEDTHVSASGTTTLAISGGGVVATLLPGRSETLTATYRVTQADVDAGDALTNEVTATATPPSGVTPPNDAATASVTPEARDPGLEVLKTARAGGRAVGDTVVFDVTVRNVGNVTLGAPSLADVAIRADGAALPTPVPAFQGGDADGDGALGVGETWAYTVEVALDQGIVDAGGFQNVVTATSTVPGGGTTSDVSDDGGAGEDDPTEVPIARNPAIAALKTVRTAPPARPMPGDAVVWELRISNTGDVTLGAPDLTEALTRADGTTVTPAPVPVFESGDAGAPGALDVGETWTYRVEHALTQADIDAGGLSNQVRADVASPAGPVSDLSDPNVPEGSQPTDVPLGRETGIETDKALVDAPVDTGARVQWDVTVTNIGNTTLSDVRIDDMLTRRDATALVPASVVFVSGDRASPEGRLLPDETATYRVFYVLTQADIDAGGIDNLATGTGNTVLGGAETDDSPLVPLDIPANPALSVVKRLTRAPPSFDAVGDVLTFAFDVTNEGNVTLPVVEIDDPLVADASCPAGPLAPDATTTCTGSYEVVQADLDRGFLTNTAAAVSGPTRSPDDSVTVPAIQNPGLEVDKEAVSVTVNGQTFPGVDPQNFVVGAEIDYRFTVTNTGNVTIVDPVEIDDNRIGIVTCPALPQGGLAPLSQDPNAALVCTESYTVTATDVDVQVVTNLASATDGTTTSPTVSETVPSGGTPALTVTKALDATSASDFAADGDPLLYRFTVENTGTVSFVNAVIVEDDRIGPLTCFAPSGADPDFRPGETIECTAPYDTTQADLDAGFVTNEAFAQTSFTGSGPTPVPVVSAPTTLTVDAAGGPAIEIVKTARTLPVTAVDQVLTYRLVAENTGNRTLRDVTITDALLPGLICPPVDLAPGEALACEEDYTVTQADVDRGTLSNTAEVAALDPQGGGVEAEDTLVVDMPEPAPVLTVEKTATPEPFGAAGSAVSYAFAVRNDGNVTLSDVVLTDAITAPPYTCVIGTLAPGEEDAISCALTVEVTQDDVDRGRIVNDATATATTPMGAPVEGADSVVSTGPDRVAALDVTKTFAPAAPAPGDVVTFRLEVANGGNVTLAVTGIADTTTLVDGTATALDAPFALVSGDDDDDGRLGLAEVFVYEAPFTFSQAVIDAGGVRNTATVTADGPDDLSASDVSDDGDDTDGNETDDPTEILVVPGPAIDLVKRVTTPGSAVGDEVVFTLTATNIGNVTLTDVTVTDVLSRADGSVVEGVAAPVRQGPDGPLGPGGVRVWTLSHLLTQADIDAGGLSNVAEVVATPPGAGAALVSDVADDGDDADGNDADDPTELLLTPAATLDVTKMVLDPAPEAVGEVARFEVVAVNAGEVTLTGLGLRDDMRDFIGATAAPETVEQTDAPGGGRLAPGASTTWVVTRAVTQSDLDAGGLRNVATVTAQGPQGDPVSDVADDGDDGDGNAVDDPTELVLAQSSILTATKAAGTPVRRGATVFAVPFTVTLTNGGNVTQTGLAVSDDLTAFAAPGRVVGVEGLALGGFDGTGRANPGFDGVADTALTQGDLALAPGAEATIAFVALVDVTAGAPERPNVAVVTGDRLETPLEAISGLVEGLVPAPLVVEKSVAPDSVVLGAAVAYRLTFTNASAFAEPNLTLVDEMPVGIAFTPGSVLFDGAAAPDPTISGTRLAWSGVDLGPGQTLVVDFTARVGRGSGEYVNRGFALDPRATLVSNVAEAVLRVRPEAVFDCGEVIGRVFDDRDLDGVQAWPEDTGRVLSDQSFGGGKGAALPEATETGEPGLPGVRVATVDGLVVTTDEFGRFSIPCAALPERIGSNFTLKLDERTLPTGYAVTTENPRTVRLTRGTMAKIDFGAARATVVDVDLTAEAFAGHVPSAALRDGLAALAARMGDVPVLLRITYLRGAEPPGTARARMDAVAALVDRLWDGADVTLERRQAVIR